MVWRFTLMKIKSFYILALSLFLIASCKSYQKVPYFQDLPQDTQNVTLPSNHQPLRMQPGDKLNIIVSSSRSASDIAASYNLPLQASRVGAMGDANYSQSTMPYYVDAKGNIDFPEIGKIRVQGMTREEIGEHIKKILLERNLLKIAVVTVEVLNHYVNVLGEVNRPGRVNIDKDRLTLLEALSQSGDLTIKGERQNVLVLRQEGDKQKAYRVDLSNAQQLMSSPVYELQQNDVVYVQPNTTRQRESMPWSNSWQNPSIYLSMTSVLVSVAVLVTNLIKN